MAKKQRIQKVHKGQPCPQHSTTSCENRFSASKLSSLPGTVLKPSSFRQGKMRVLILGATPFQAQQHQPWTKQHHQNQGKLHSIETIRILFSHCDSWFTPFYNLCGVLKGILHSIAMHSNIKTLCNLEATALWWQEHPKCLKCQHATQCEALDWNTVTTPLDNNT